MSVTRVGQLAAALVSAMPGWRILAGPTPFTWAPDRHLRVSVTDGRELRRIVLRHSWSDQAHELERRLYREVLPHVGIRVPDLIACLAVDPSEPQWMVLGDMGSRHLRADKAADREAFLGLLGTLHAKTHDMLTEGRLRVEGLPRFDGQAQLAHWHDLIQNALQTPRFEVEPWMPRLAQAVFRELQRLPLAINHGDTDFSNAVLGMGGVCLVDWERAQIGPPAPDLGRVMAAVEHDGELQAYRQAFVGAGTTHLSPQGMQLWADIALAHHCIRWVCYYLEAHGRGKGPGADWRASYYVPCLAGLRKVRDRRPEWTSSS